MPEMLPAVRRRSALPDAGRNGRSLYCWLAARREAVCQKIRYCHDHFYGYPEGVKTTPDIPDDLFRLAKARAALDGVSLRQFVTDTLLWQAYGTIRELEVVEPIP